MPCFGPIWQTRFSRHCVRAQDPFAIWRVPNRPADVCLLRLHIRSICMRVYWLRPLLCLWRLCTDFALQSSVSHMQKGWATNQDFLLIAGSIYTSHSIYTSIYINVKYRMLKYNATTSQQRAIVGMYMQECGWEKHATCAGTMEEVVEYSTSQQLLHDTHFSFSLIYHKTIDAFWMYTYLPEPEQPIMRMWSMQ